jgi:hypothetical protein
MTTYSTGTTSSRALVDVGVGYRFANLGTGHVSLIEEIARYRPLVAPTRTSRNISVVHGRFDDKSALRCLAFSRIESLNGGLGRTRACNSPVMSGSVNSLRSCCAIGRAR